MHKKTSTCWNQFPTCNFLKVRQKQYFALAKRYQCPNVGYSVCSTGKTTTSTGIGPVNTAWISRPLSVKYYPILCFSPLQFLRLVIQTYIICKIFKNCYSYRMCHHFRLITDTSIWTKLFFSWFGLSRYQQVFPCLDPNQWFKSQWFTRVTTCYDVGFHYLELCRTCDIG